MTSVTSKVRKGNLGTGDRLGFDLCGSGAEEKHTPDMGFSNCGKEQTESPIPEPLAKFT